MDESFQKIFDRLDELETRIQEVYEHIEDIDTTALENIEAQVDDIAGHFN